MGGCKTNTGCQGLSCNFDHVPGLYLSHFTQMANLLQRWPFTNHQLWTEPAGIHFRRPSSVSCEGVQFESSLIVLHSSSSLHACCVPNWLPLTWSPLAVDVAGGVAEGVAGWRVRRIRGGRSGPDQTVRPAAADHPAGYCQCHQRGRGPYSTAQVRATTSFIMCQKNYQSKLKKVYENTECSP